MSKLNITFHSLNEQREFFLWKFPSLTTRDEISCLQAEFSRFDKTFKGTIDEVHALMVMDARGVSKSAFELRLITSQYGGEKSEGRSFSFLEICCAVYETDWDALNDFVDDEARDRALLTAKAAADEIEIAAAKISDAKIEEEKAAELRAATIEEESRLTGVAGMSAFFLRQHIEGCRGTALTNEQQVRQEAARRRELRMAKQKLKDAVDEAVRHRASEEIKNDVLRNVQRIAAQEAAAAEKLKEEEAAARSARKAALNNAWMSKIPQCSIVGSK